MLAIKLAIDDVAIAYSQLLTLLLFLLLDQLPSWAFTHEKKIEGATIHVDQPQNKKNLAKE
jgi:hypothetical protein